MENNLKYIIVLIAISLAIFGIFYLIFPTVSAMMIWCVVTGILATVTLGCNIFMVSTKGGITVKNASTTWALNTAAVILFVWTLMYVFLFGSYIDVSRSLSGMYIGYLIIFILGITVWLIADRGASAAQAHSDAVQADIQGRDSYLMQLKQLQLNLDSLQPEDSLRAALNHNVDLMRNVPAARFTSPIVGQQLSDAIMQLDAAIESNDTEAMRQANKKLSLTLNSLRL